MEDEFDIAGWVAAARKKKEMSQEALGELLGKTKGNISAWEKGRHEPSFKQVLQIAAITEYPLPASIKVELPKNEAFDRNATIDDVATLIAAYRHGNEVETKGLLGSAGTILQRVAEDRQRIIRNKGKSGPL